MCCNTFTKYLPFLSDQYNKIFETIPLKVIFNNSSYIHNKCFSFFEQIEMGTLFLHLCTFFSFSRGSLNPRATNRGSLARSTKHFANTQMMDGWKHEATTYRYIFRDCDATIISSVCCFVWIYTVLQSTLISGPDGLRV